MEIFRQLMRLYLIQNYLTEEIFIELYEEIVSSNSINNPIVIHSENESIFKSRSLLNFLSSKKVKGLIFT